MTTTNRFSDAIAAETRFLRGQAILMVNDKEAGFDLAQDTILKALEKQHLFDGKNLRGWLITILYRTCFDQYRIAKRLVKDTFVSDSLYQGDTDILISYNEGESNLQCTDWQVLIDGLTTNQKRVMTLLAIGYTYKDIVEETGILRGTVGAQIHHARNQLAVYK